MVVTDLFMEEMDGMTLVTRIHAENPLTPVIMLSGQARIPDAVKATHLGTSAFLTKPIAKEAFLAEINTHIRPRRPEGRQRLVATSSTAAMSWPSSWSRPNWSRAAM